MDHLAVVFWPRGASGALLGIPIPLQAGGFPRPILSRHAGEPPLFALTDFFAGGVRPALLLDAHPAILRLTLLTLPRAQVGDDGNTIEGRWDVARDGASCEHDFDLTYVGVR